MSFDIRLPNITASTDAGKLQQIQSYMYQLVGQLNWALNNMGGIGGTPTANPGTAATAASKDDPIRSFNSIKGLIIKSADIVKAYYEQINDLLKLSGEYVAESDFGTFAEQTTAQVTANSQSIRQVFTDIQKLSSAMDQMNIGVAAHIHSGLLYYDDLGAPVFGLEIGQRTEVDGVETFHKYAQFTADRLAFFDRNGYEVAYISDRKLFITEVEITGSQVIGGFRKMVVPGVGVVTKWIGG